MILKSCILHTVLFLFRRVAQKLDSVAFPWFFSCQTTIKTSQKIEYSQVYLRVLWHECFDWLSNYLFWSLFLVFLSCFQPCSSSNWCVQLNVGLYPNALKLFEYYSVTPLYFCVLVLLRTRKVSERRAIGSGLKPFLCKGLRRHRNIYKE